MVSKYYPDRDYTKELCVFKLIEYLEKSDRFTSWLINEYALYVDEWIEERENSINAFKEYLKEDNCYIYQKIIEEKELELRELKGIKYLIKNSYKLIESKDE